MKNTLKIVLLFLVTILLLTPICIATNEGIEPRTDGVEDSTEENGTYIASDVYKFNDTVLIDNIVDGNAFAFGKNITITGEIGGDLFAFGNNITIAEEAYIHGSIFAFAQNITMEGVCYDLYAVSGSFTLDDNAVVARDIRLGADNVYINGQIKRDAYLATSNLVFPENATELITGNLNYSSDRQFSIPEGAVGGETKFDEVTPIEPSAADLAISYINSVLTAVLYSLAVVLFTIWLAPKFKEKAGTILKKKSVLSFGVGLLASIILIIGAFALLIITGGLAIGVSLAVIVTYILALTISKTVFGMACSKLILDKLNKQNSNILFVISTALVVLVVSLIGIIPYVGGIVTFIITMLGFGITVFNLINRKPLEENVSKE